MLIFAIFLVLIALTAFITCSIVGSTAKKKAAETKDDWNVVRIQRLSSLSRV